MRAALCLPNRTFTVLYYCCVPSYRGHCQGLRRLFETSPRRADPSPRSSCSLIDCITAMVLFTMTASIVDCLDQLGDGVSELQRDEEPSLASRAVGKPISHSQVLRLWKRLQSSKEPVALESLLFGVQIYTPPPPPKPEQVRCNIEVCVDMLSNSECSRPSTKPSWRGYGAKKTSEPTSE